MSCAYPAPIAHDRRSLFEGLGVSVSEYRCRAAVAASGPEEPNSSHSVALVRRGIFRREHRGETVLADAQHVLFFHAGEPYRYAHPVPGGDDCTILTLDPAVALRVARHVDPRAEERPGRPFPRGTALSDRRTARLHYELLRGIDRGLPTLALEDTLAALLDAALACARPTSRRCPAEQGDAHAARRRRDLVEEAKLLLNAGVDAPPGLEAMAARLGCSPFHLSRTFAAVTGVGLRRYLAGLRSRLAADRLRAGAPDLTALALDLGFADHSHFTNTFRREWGVPPSRLRRVATG